MPPLDAKASRSMASTALLRRGERGSEWRGEQMMRAVRKGEGIKGTKKARHD